MVLIAKYIILLFALFILSVGFLMLYDPNKARHILRKAGSTPLINYTELSLRMVPAFSMVMYAEYAHFPLFFSLLGYFMIATSVILMIIPRQWHHQYALQCAEILQPMYVRFMSIPSFIFGAVLIYNVW